MQDNLVIRNKDDAVLNADEPLKLTALLYLREALEQEQYEDCAELIAAAKGFGAQKSEVSKLIGGYVRELQNGGPYEANRNIGRRRF